MYGGVNSCLAAGMNMMHAGRSRTQLGQSTYARLNLLNTSLDNKYECEGIVHTVYDPRNNRHHTPMSFVICHVMSSRSLFKTDIS